MRVIKIIIQIIRIIKSIYKMSTKINKGTWEKYRFQEMPKIIKSKKT